MKKKANSFCTLLLVVTVLGCNKNGPKDVAHTWLTDFYHLDYDGAKKISTENTKVMLAQLAAWSGMVPETDSSKIIMKKSVVTIKSVKESGDSAWVTYTVSGAGKDNANPENPPLVLLRQNGKWLVAFTKDDLTGGAEAADTAAASPDGASAPDTTHIVVDTSQH